MSPETGLLVTSWLVRDGHIIVILTRWTSYNTQRKIHPRNDLEKLITDRHHSVIDPAVIPAGPSQRTVPNIFPDLSSRWDQRFAQRLSTARRLSSSQEVYMKECRVISKKRRLRACVRRVHIWCTYFWRSSRLTVTQRLGVVFSTRREPIKNWGIHIWYIIYGPLFRGLGAISERPSWAADTPIKVIRAIVEPC